MGLRLVLMTAALVAVVTGVARAENRTQRGRVDLDVVVPIDPQEHERLHWFGRRDHHHLVPGTVTIDRAPYVCDAHRRRFSDRDRFVAHLRGVHAVSADDIPDSLIVRDGVVHYSGETQRKGVDTR